jgi:hypothetical protein
MKLELLNKTILICAKRNSGKSKLVKYLIKQFKNQFNEIFLISTTNDVTNEFNDLIKKEFIFNEFNEKWLLKLFEKMELITKEIGFDKPENEYKHVLLILDDCVSEDNIRNSKTFEKLFSRGRHYKISVIFISQSIRFLNTTCRNNLDFLLISQMNSQALDRF